MESSIYRIIYLLYIFSIVINTFASESEQLIFINKCPNSLNLQENFNINIPQHLISHSNESQPINFKLTKPNSPFKCDNDMYIVKLSTTPTEKAEDIDSNCRVFDIKSKQPHFFTSLGVLMNNEEYFMQDEYCINDFNISFIEIHVCTSSCTKNKPCIKKCCKPGYSVSLTTMSCKISGKLQWIPIFYQNPYTILSKNLIPHYIKSPVEEEQCSNNENNNNPFELTGIWPLKNIITPLNDTFEKLSWRLLQDGTITYLGRNRKWNLLNKDKFCIDGILDLGEDEYYSGSSQDQIVLYWEEDIKTESLSMVYIIMMFISSIFLFLTTFVYILLFDKQNIHGWTVLCYCSSMFLMYIFLATAHLIGLYRTNEQESGSKLCVTIGILSHFFFLSSFCWLTLINFDLCFTFRSYIPGTGRSKGLKRFLYYLSFALALPLLVVITGIILDHEFPDIESEVIVPEYGQVTCFILSSARGVYLYYIIAALLICNFILITITVLTIYRLRQNSKIILSGRSTKHHQSIKLFTKLFVIMGVTWIFEILSWSLSSKNKIEWYWVVFDMINFFQAILIFIIFVCKQNTLTQIFNRIPFLKKLFSWTLSSTSNNTIEKSNPVQLEHKTSTTRVTSSKFSLNKPNKVETEF